MSSLKSMTKLEDLTVFRIEIKVFKFFVYVVPTFTELGHD